MKTRALFSGLTVAATLLTASCVDSMYGTGGHTYNGGRVTTYPTPPSEYAGGAYQDNRRYASGGKSESGYYAVQESSRSPYRRYGNRQPTHDTVSDLPSSSNPFHLRHPSFGRRL